MKKRLQMQRKLTSQLETACEQNDLREKPSFYSENGVPRINQYTCWTCGGVITTIDRDKGVTPAMLACRATEGCEGTMHSHRYQVSPTLKPDHEWYKPAKLPKDREMQQYIEMGGLVVRKINE